MCVKKSELLPNQTAFEKKKKKKKYNTRQLIIVYIFMAERNKAVDGCLYRQFFDCEGGDGCAYTFMLRAFGIATVSLKTEGREITETFTNPSSPPTNCEGSKVGPHGCGKRVSCEIHGY